MYYVLNNFVKNLSKWPIIHIILNTSQYGPVLFGSLGVAVTVVPISPLFTAGEVARVRETILNE